MMLWSLPGEADRRRRDQVNLSKRPLSLEPNASFLGAEVGKAMVLQ
jgi:hypothetical protein